MSKKKLRYLGNGPGQGEGVAIGGIKYKPFETYDVDDDLAAVLLRKGGFEVAVPVVKKIERKAKEETES
ncbi:unnamed protein product [marine sediment metagenome]|uniref:Uncharacterized protein n=1 Tax=marine sediment metagenome TaxID=412755 RepID=X0Y743_9ZZZZ